MLPIGTIGKSSFRPYMTFTLIALNVLVFLIEIPIFLSSEATQIHFFRTYALNACQIGVEPFLITFRNALFTMFLHGNPMHILFNMVFLWIFAPRVEEYFGAKRFLTFYLIVGFLATIAHVVLGGIICPVDQFGKDILVGASGAIAGVMGAFLFLYPGARIRTAILIFRIPVKVINVPAFLYLVVWVATDVLGLVFPDGGNVAHWAHIGGFLSGLGLLFMATLFVPAPKVDQLEQLEN